MAERYRIIDNDVIADVTETRGRTRRTPTANECS